MAASRRSIIGACDPSPLLGRGHEAVGAVLAFDRSNPRVGQVEANQFRSVMGKPVQ